MNLGDVSRRLGVGVTQDLLNSLGIEYVGKNKRAFLYSEEQWPQICKVLANYIRGRVDAPPAERPESKPKAAKTAPPPADDEDDEL